MGLGRGGGERGTNSESFLNVLIPSLGVRSELGSLDEKKSICGREGKGISFGALDMYFWKDW